MSLSKRARQEKRNITIDQAKYINMGVPTRDSIRNVPTQASQYGIKVGLVS